MGASRPDDIPCPECGADVRMGLPYSATVEAAVTTPDPELDEEFTDEDARRKKRRHTTCPHEHTVYVYFDF